MEIIGGLRWSIFMIFVRTSVGTSECQTRVMPFGPMARLTSAVSHRTVGSSQGPATFSRFHWIEVGLDFNATDRGLLAPQNPDRAR